jgi:hypothetical protein
MAPLSIMRRIFLLDFFHQPSSSGITGGSNIGEFLLLFNHEGNSPT